MCIALHCDTSQTLQNERRKTFTMPRRTSQKLKETSTRASCALPTSANFQLTEPATKRPRRMASTVVLENGNHPRPLTKADIPTIVSAVVEARDDQLTCATHDARYNQPTSATHDTRDDQTTSAIIDAHSGSNHPTAAPGDPAKVPVNIRAPICPV